MLHFFAHTSLSIKPPRHFTLPLRFTFYQLHTFYNLILSFSSTCQLVPLCTMLGCFCSPISFIFTSEWRFEIVLVQIEQFNTVFYLHFSVIPLLLFLLAHLILSLLVLQNVSGKIFTELFKTGARDIIIPVLHFLGSSILLILALVCDPSYLIIILINLQIFLSYMKLFFLLQLNGTNLC